MKILFFAVFIFFHTSLLAQLIIMPNEAIKAIYPKATEYQRTPLLLTHAEAKEVQKLIGKKLSSKIFVYFLIKQEEDIIAYAGLYTAHVRSKTATYMVLITPKGKIHSIEVIAFNEPPEYTPKKRWLHLFENKGIDDNLKIKESIPNLSGATLSARSASDTAKLLLAVWNVKFKQRKPL